MQIYIFDKEKDAKGLQEIELQAVGTSDAGIEFYMWDLDYQNGKFKPNVLFDKQGIQLHKFKSGSHQVAVKAVDNEGLESTEIIHLKINRVTQINPKSKP